MISPLQVAIIGSGDIARTHVDAIALLPDVHLAAVCSRNPEKARELAAPSASQVFDSVEKLLSSAGLDAVLVATPSGAHEEAVLPALRAGRHVLCEKPLEISTARVARMIAEAERSGVILAGFFPLRCGAGAQIIREALDAGRFGRLTFLSARVKWWRDQDYYRASSWRGSWELDGGGALMNQGIHAVDLLQWMGGPVKEVSAFADALAHPGLQVEDTLAACVRFESGALGTIEAGTSCYPGLDLSLEISGDCGTAILVNDRIESWRFAEEKPEDEAVRSDREGGKIHGGSSDPKAITCEGHRQQIAEFCRAIRGEPATMIEGREAGKSVAIIEAAYRSCRSGKSETVSTA
ncbi:MAG: Gfo/Idh/MocA family protein [Terrimicrobiaceae bacterium]